jgi:SAM-dependent methyltransferase
MNFKSFIAYGLRKAGGAKLADHLRYRWFKFQNRGKNLRFSNLYSHIKLPPDYLMYESFRLDYEKYYFGGREVAEWLISIFNQHSVPAEVRVLDWGCGPGRIVRHLPDLMGQGCEIFATDYNNESIGWCKENLENIRFNCNGLEAILPYHDNYFDIIYGISILTHLSEESHNAWKNELYRILKPGGILLLTSHGIQFRQKLTPSEQKLFDSGSIVVRKSRSEGHRTYAAFHPPDFMKQLFSAFKIEDHITPAAERGKWLPQDVWVLRKNSNS